MNEFVIVGGLPYLLHGGRTYAVRWDDKGFTVGAEVKLASVPAVVYPELSILAKCAGHLDSIGAAEKTEPDATNPAAEKTGLDALTLEELKEYAEMHGVKLGSARTKASMIKKINEAVRS